MDQNCRIYLVGCLHVMVYACLVVSRHTKEPRPCVALQSFRSPEEQRLNARFPDKPLVFCNVRICVDRICILFVISMVSLKFLSLIVQKAALGASQGLGFRFGVWLHQPSPYQKQLWFLVSCKIKWRAETALGAHLKSVLKIICISRLKSSLWTRVTGLLPKQVLVHQNRLPLTAAVGHTFVRN